MKTFILYARYSSDLQNSKSCEDQLTLCREYVEKFGGYVAEEYSDDAISGKTLQRPGVKKLLLSIENRPGVILLCESLDRISRDQGDMSFIYKLLEFHNVELHTLHDGKVDKIHITIKGYLAEVYVDDLGKKTRRGQFAVAKSGRIASGSCYGYDNRKEYDDSGALIKGLRQINEDHAAVIRRIFKEYAEGDLLKDIVARLNEDEIPSPSGILWKVNSILGSRKRLIGILNNPLYNGQIIFNKQTFVRDPKTGKKRSRSNPPEEWIRQDAHELRIVDKETWHKVKRRQKKGERKEHAKTSCPLSPKTSCKCCGKPIWISMRGRHICSTYQKDKSCKNSKTFKTEILMIAISEQLQQMLKKEGSAILHKIRLKAELQKSEIKAECKEYKTKISRLLEFVADGRGTESTKKKIAEFENCIDILNDRLDRTRLPDGRAFRPLYQRLKNGASLHFDLEFQEDFASLVHSVKIDENQNVEVLPDYEAIYHWMQSELNSKKAK